MKPWLDDLSEEWVPQETPPPNAQNGNDPSATQTSQSVPPKPRSRLPRLRHSSGTYSDIQIRHIRKDLHPLRPKSVLAERSLNDNNIPPAESADADNAARSRSASQSLASSQGSVVYSGTVAQKPVSPGKERHNQNTPEWKRRLLKGERAYGEQKDLFSPMGLENIFQKPSDGAPEEPKPRKSKLDVLKGLSAMPSSPPPWPSEEGPKGDHPAQQEQKDSVDCAQAEEDAVDPDSSVYFSSLNPIEVPAAEDKQDAPRTVSGQIEFENENFSPVYLSTNLRVNPSTNIAAVPDFSASTLAQRLRHIGTPPPTFERQPASDAASAVLDRSQNDSSLVRIQDDTLPEDLPAGTPDVGDRLTPFVERRRGGYSQDQSFLRRPLSPSPQRKTVGRDMTEHRKTSTSDNGEKRLSGENRDSVDNDESVQSPSLRPLTPHGPKHSQYLSPEKQSQFLSPDRQSQFLSPERPQTSASPLKLFDAHDTFTSNRLQRRLSQLEHRSERAVSASNRGESVRVEKKTSRMTSVEEVSIHNMLDKVALGPTVSQGVIQERRVGTFGQGELDQYTFQEDFSVLSSQSSIGQDSGPDGSPSTDVAPPGSRQPIRFQFDGSPPSLQSSRARRQGLTRVSNPFRKVTYSKSQSVQGAFFPRLQVQTEPLAEKDYAEGKRGPTSPFKNPTPKRRRTLYSVANDNSNMASDGDMSLVKDSHAAMQSAMTRERKDAEPQNPGNSAKAEMGPRRSFTRPRNPTPNQRMREDLHAEILEVTDAFLLSSPKVDTIRKQLDSPAGPGKPSDEAQAARLAQEIAEFNINRSEVRRDESRKRSVTTQDFLNEAVKIMDYIRAKGRPTSGLESLEESQSELPFRPDDDNFLPSTPLSFSRPPSREGQFSAWREPNKRDIDPNIMSHLRKYEERESEGFMGSSVRSLRLPRRDRSDSVEGNSVIVEQNNIRITDNLDRHNRDSERAEEGFNTHSRTNDTHASAASSLGQTVATNVSRRSEHVTNLAPAAIAHLIPEQIGGMSFDRDKNMWVRNKSPSKEHHPEDVSATNESEEDPFGNIPDLTVDETAEVMLQNQSSPTRPQATAETFLEETEEDVSVHQDLSRPTTRDGKGTAATDTSSVPSKFSNHFAWSFPKTETRATSWSDQGTRNAGTQKTQPPSTTYPIPESDELDVEHEIKYFEGRGTITPPKRKVRDITFSIGHQSETNSPQKNMRQKWPCSNVRQTPRAQGTPWRQVPGAKTLPPSRNHAIPENGDLSALGELPSRNYRMQVSMSVSAPLLGVQKQDALMAVPSSPVRGDVTFMLSDLPDFTLHQVDECEVPDRVIVKHDGNRFSKALEDRYALGTADLVKALQDVAPNEPYWEDLRKLDLHDKGLANLHRLEEFCYRLEELDVSNNGISQVKGVPYTLRRLHARNNTLTGLTTWTSLMNLQHLDISGNDIENLDGLSELIHLRTLKVDNNHVKSLDGVLLLDGLMELSISGNEILTVDFAKTDLKSLTDLNLSGNRLKEVRNLHRLPQLRSLDLDGNCIEQFPSTDPSTEKCNYLQSLRINRNNLVTIDVARYCPKLESLYADGNSLVHIPGLEDMRHLHTFSARSQSLTDISVGETCVRNLVRNAEVRSLYLSVNPTRGFELSQHLLNLQRLELASMGLQELPYDFGQLTPNLRTVNLNFNSLQDLRPLLNIKRLNELLVAGNKLSRLRTNLAVLGKLPTLEKLDMRDNPLTLRFYAPTSENRLLSLRPKTHAEENDADRFVLPDGDPDVDNQYLQRLDFETRLRRRVQEIMLSTQCRNLRELDGLPFDKARVLVKDDIWDRLSYLGVIRKAEGPSRITNGDESYV